MINLNRLFGLLSGTARWKMLVATVVVRRLKAAGLNIINFNVKCACLHLSCFLSLRDEFGCCKWHYLARYFLGNRLAVFDDRFSFFLICFHRLMFLLLIMLNV